MPFQGDDLSETLRTFYAVGGILIPELAGRPARQVEPRSPMASKPGRCGQPLVLAGWAAGSCSAPWVLGSICGSLLLCEGVRPTFAVPTALGLWRNYSLTQPWAASWGLHTTAALPGWMWGAARHRGSDQPAGQGSWRKATGLGVRQACSVGLGVSASVPTGWPRVCTPRGDAQSI